MSRRDTFDFIIAGAGAAGLSLIYEILNSDRLSKLNILLLDKSLEPNSDKTWCFWDKNSISFKSLIYHTWDSLEVTAHNNRFTEELSEYKYHCIRSIDFSDKIFDEVKNHPNVTLLEADITGFSSRNEMATVETSEGNFSAPNIFQSALRPPGYETNRVDISLMQHFMGWEIKTKAPQFDPKKAILMDFDVQQMDGVTFMYVLPFTETEALIEHTLFSGKLLSDSEYEEGIRAYLIENYGLKDDDYTILRKEKGVIPMEDRHYPAWYCDRVLNIGTVGGLTKPSTGYTFTRIQQHTKEIVHALENDLPLPVSKASSYRFRVYDMMLLYLLENHESTSITIFRELFKRNRFDRILKFLEEKTHPGQEIKIFSSLPYMPFFKAIWKMKHRIVTGA